MQDCNGAVMVQCDRARDGLEQRFPTRRELLLRLKFHDFKGKIAILSCIYYYSIKVYICIHVEKKMIIIYKADNEFR